MRAADVMTTKVISVALESEVREIASLLAEHGISAVPVVDSEQRVLGIVSEGDLIRRIENDEDSHKSWWLKLFSGTSVVDYVKAHGRCAGEVMTPDPLTVSEDEPLHRIAGLLEKYRIKRVPVVRDGRLVGIVSRSNLLRGFATAEPEIEASIDDRNIRKAIYKELKALSGLWDEHLTVIVSNGCVQLWGLVETKEQRWAVQVAAENAPGVKQVINHLGLRPRGIGGY